MKECINCDDAGRCTATCSPLPKPQKAMKSFAIIKKVIANEVHIVTADTEDDAILTLEQRTYDEQNPPTIEWDSDLPSDTWKIVELDVTETEAEELQQLLLDFEE